MGRTRFRMMPVALGVILLLAAAGVPAVTATTSDSAAEVDAARITALGDSTGALGVYWDRANHEFVLVYPTTIDAPDPSVLKATGLAIRLQYSKVTPQDVKWAQDQLSEASIRGDLDGGSWALGLDLFSGLIRVSGSGDRSVVQPILDALGDRAYFVPMQREEPLGRLDDIPPFWGGARIVDISNRACTSGFAVRRTASGLPYMITADHCYGIGSAVKTPNGTYVGSIDFEAPYPSRDFEFYGGVSYGGRIYLGNTLPGTEGYVVGAHDPMVGDAICTGGSVSLEQCDKVVIALNQMKCNPGCTYLVFTFTNGNELIPGDSGGPVYAKSGTNVTIRGIILAKAGTTGFAQQWGTIASYWGGVTICTVGTC
jgi:hypothetical protein